MHPLPKQNKTYPLSILPSSLSAAQLNTPDLTTSKRRLSSSSLLLLPLYHFLLRLPVSHQAAALPSRQPHGPITLPSRTTHHFRPTSAAVTPETLSRSYCLFSSRQLSLHFLNFEGNCLEFD